MIHRIFIACLLCFFLLGCKSKKPGYTDEDYDTVSQPGKPQINETFLPQYISKVTGEIILDGAGTEKDWDKSVWRNMDQLMLGDMPTKEDFSGRYKLLWDEEVIYMLVEIEDDIFMDVHRDGLEKYWDDDCLEIFVDEDRSRGPHQYDYNAFAYHLSLDDKVVDMGIHQKPQYYNDHLLISKQRDGNKIVWELGVKLYSDKYDDDNPEASRVKLASRKQIGFMVAYCDNDNSTEREHFVGDMFIPGEDKNMGWIDAGVFGQLNLKE